MKKTSTSPYIENKPNVAGKDQLGFLSDYLTDSMNYHPVRSENQANIHAGQQEANHHAGTEDIIDAGDSEKEDESAQDCFVLPIWPSYSSTITPALKTDGKREGTREEEQVFLDELERLKRQENKANEEAEALKKDTPAKASSTNLVNTVNLPVSTASPHEGLSLSDPTNPEEDDSEIPPLEDIYQNSTDGIFTNSSYNDEGAVADFTNLETVMNVSPIPTSRIISSHPSALILRDPTSAVQTRSKVNKSSGAHAFVSYKFKQLCSDEEMARKIQEEWEGEEERNRLAEEKATNEALIRNYDDIKARIKADRLLAEKLQEEEREQFTIEERAKFLHDTIAAQRKFLAQQRSEAIRNRPPTKNQLRNQMITYLKHVGNFKHSDLKTKKFEEIQALYEKIKRSDEDFISIGSAEDERLIKKMNEKGIDSSKNEMVKEEDKEEESTRKRKLGTRKKKKSRKRRFKQNISEDDSEKENDELRIYIKMRQPEGVHTLMTEAGLVIHMLVEKKYPLRKKVLLQMLELKLESEEDSTMALEFIRFVKKLVAELEPEDSNGDEEDL
ncbi:hypothetical protein Tco_0541375 [Tanacetum coccineum]